MTTCLRPLEKNDYYKNYMNLINTFTRTPLHTTYEQFITQFDKICNQNIRVVVIELDNVIIATGSLIIESKLHNNFKNMGHIEDVVVDPYFRHQSYGTTIIDELIKIGTQNNCYKIILNCNSDYTKFYKSKGFTIKGIEMCMYI